MKTKQVTKYFIDLTEESEIKAKYKELAKEHHPDRGGDVEIMKQINAQYILVLRGFYQKAGKSITEIDELMKKDKEASDALQLIIGLDHINVELCGNWVWVTGNTKDVKEVLKNAKFKWAFKKKAWYWRPEDYKKKWHNGQLSLEEIRNKYGSARIKKTRSKLVYS